MSLDERKQKILGAVVRDYVETVRPVGSEDLAARHPWGVKSATIRNELAELSELGYLRQPHTSAGRIPSDQGYRFYVDHLMVLREMDTSAQQDGERPSELDRLLRQTCALLTRHTSYTSVATPPRPADVVIRQIVVSPVSEERLLLVLLLSTGQVENLLLPDADALSPSDCVSLVNALNAAFAGKTLAALCALAAPFPAPASFSALLRGWHETLAAAVCRMAQRASEEEVFLEGAGEILRQPEFRETTKWEGVLDTLQTRTLLLQTLSRALGPDVAVVIGTENHIAAMQECSIVSASYYVGTRERGTIGVVGPTRMDYDRAVPAVGFFARALTRTLTHLGLS